MRRHHLLAVPLVAGFGVARAGAPVVYCASDPAGVAFSLTVAADNGLDDVIRLVGGDYELTAGLTFSTDESNTLDISGGWNADCTQQNGGATILDGGGEFAILDLESSVPSYIHVSGISFLNGYQLDGDLAGGLSVITQGQVLVEQNQFVLNRHDGFYAGGLEVYAGGALTVRNNLFIGNAAPRGVAAASLYRYGSADASATGNTVVGNQMAGDGATGGLFIVGDVDAHFYVSNNIAWNNVGGDVYIGNSGAGTTLLHNDIGVLDGEAPDADSEGNVSVDPVFADGILNFNLASSSPLVNAGINAPPGGIGAYDLRGAQRLQPPHVDIGAYETDVIFYGGFEALP